MNHSYKKIIVPALLGTLFLGACSDDASFECCITAKKPRKGAIHLLKDIFRDTTRRKEKAFYTALPSEKNNTGREKLCSPGGGGAATLGYGAAVPL